MDRAQQKLRRIHQVSGWILDHWANFPDNLYRLVDGDYMPFDMREFLEDLVSQDLANAITPAINWRLLAGTDGVMDEIED